MADKQEGLIVEGTVVESLRGKFRVQIDGASKEGSDESPNEPPKEMETEHLVLAHLAGKLRKNFIKIVPGDKVRVELSPYDLTRGRITYRMK